MLKQSLVGRNPRSQGFKVKHVFQICVLLAVCVWLLFQLKRSYKSSVGLTENVESVHDILKLGRKGIDPRVVEEKAASGNHEKGEEDGESKIEDNVNEEGGGGGSKDELIDRAEEEGYGGEDPIDEDDKERDGNEEKENQVEDASSLEDANNKHR